MIPSEAVCDDMGLSCFSWAADQHGDEREMWGIVGWGFYIASQGFQEGDVWREGRPMDEALYVRERCLTASRQGSSSSSSCKRGVPMISAASGRSLGLQDSMLCTMLSYTQRENIRYSLSEQLQHFIH